MVVAVLPDPAAAHAVAAGACSVIVLEDNDVVHLSGGGYGVYNTEQSDVEEAVPRVLLTLQMEVEQIMKVRCAAMGPGPGPGHARTHRTCRPATAWRGLHGPWLRRLLVGSCAVPCRAVP